MGWWTALLGAMGTRRADRIARADADQLLAGHPAGPSHAGLAALLSDAAAPPRPAELAGEADAVAAFHRLRSATPSIVGLSTVDAGFGGHRRPGGSLWRGTTVRLAIAALLLAIVGTATVTLAFRPAHVQPTPTPVASSAPAPNPSLSPSSSIRQQPPPTSRPPSPSVVHGPAAASTGISDPALATHVCEVWITTTDKATRDQLADRLAPLIDRLDGPNGLPAFCRKLVETQPTAATASSTTKTKTKAAQVTPAAAKSINAKKGD